MGEAGSGVGEATVEIDGIVGIGDVVDVVAGVGGRKRSLVGVGGGNVVASVAADDPPRKEERHRDQYQSLHLRSRPPLDQSEPSQLWQSGPLSAPATGRFLAVVYGALAGRRIV